MHFQVDTEHEMVLGGRRRGGTGVLLADAKCTL
jgi:hypothetical protein